MFQVTKYKRQISHYGVVLIILALLIASLAANVHASGLPIVEAISPMEVAVGNAGFTMSVFGSGFTTQSVVRFNGADHSTNYVSPSELEAYIGKSDLMTKGSFRVTVLTGADESNAAMFTVMQAAQMVSSISPTSKMLGSGAGSLTVQGSGFTSLSVVCINGSPRPTLFVSQGQLVAEFSDGDCAEAGTFNITVYDQGSNGGVSNSASFVVLNPTPTLQRVMGEVIDAGNVKLTLFGTNFVQGVRANVNGMVVGTEFLDNSRAVIRLENSYLDEPISINVVNPAPSVGQSNILTYNGVPLLPFISMISPSTEVAGEPGFTMHVYGRNFSEDAVVNVGKWAHSTRFISPNELATEISADELRIAKSYLVSVSTPRLDGVRSNMAELTVVGSGERKGIKGMVLEGSIPNDYALDQNYPNPFNPTTEISLALPFASTVTLKMYNSLGQEVATLLNGEDMAAGTHSINFDAGSLSSGIYFYQIIAQGRNDGHGEPSVAFRDSKRMILQR
ncbi:MAG: T9SS type A sorting domain-containing protein [Ignavibacteriae bacterium]|nr:T9SS type A sorting domain-containing protein [Ignavibacteriota bacterium]